MAKWMANLSVLGYCWFGETGGLIWFVFFNPAMVILYVTLGIILTLVCYGTK